MVRAVVLKVTVGIGTAQTRLPVMAEVLAEVMGQARTDVEAGFETAAVVAVAEAVSVAAVKRERIRSIHQVLKKRLSATSRPRAVSRSVCSQVVSSRNAMQREPLEGLLTRRKILVTRRGWESTQSVMTNPGLGSRRLATMLPKTMLRGTVHHVRKVPQMRLIATLSEI